MGIALESAALGKLQGGGGKEETPTELWALVSLRQTFTHKLSMIESKTR